MPALRDIVEDSEDDQLPFDEHNPQMSGHVAQSQSNDASSFPTHSGSRRLGDAKQSHACCAANANATAATKASVLPFSERPALPTAVTDQLREAGPSKSRRRTKASSQFVSAADLLAQTASTSQLNSIGSAFETQDTLREDSDRVAPVASVAVSVAAKESASSTTAQKKSPDLTIASSDADSDELQAPKQLRAGIKRFLHGNTKAIPSTSSTRQLPPEATGADIQPTGRRPANTSSRPSAVATSSLTVNEPPSVVLPPRAQVKLLDQCPLCRLAWTANKTAASKETHLKTCARTNGFDSDTIHVLIGDRIIHLARTTEVARRQAEAERTMFDRVIGTGEGVNSMREVVVVGVEGSRMLGAQKAQMDELQSHLNKQRKRPPKSQVTEVAKRILQERSSNADPHLSTEWDSAGISHRILHITDGSTVHRQQAVLDQCHGTGLTQATQPRKLATNNRGARIFAKRYDDSESDVIIVDEDYSQLPATQPFTPSEIASRAAVDLGGVVQSAHSPNRLPSLWCAAASGHAELDDDWNTSLSLSSNCTSPASSMAPVADGRGWTRDGDSSLPHDIQVLSIDTSGDGSGASDLAEDEEGQCSEVHATLSHVSVEAEHLHRESPSMQAPATKADDSEPDWTLFTVKQLQDKVAEYGFRRARVKAVLVQQMHDIWQSMSRVRSNANVGSPVTGNASACLGETRPVVVRSSKQASEGDQLDQLRRAIKDDLELYCKILRYEPVHIDAFTALLAKHGVKMAKSRLVRFLDHEVRFNV
ncbi:hypothetical protein OIV83_002150 [Microbotryomycetes sp. JL201]|nr:hypothetical protein OIV83_002150 [Microbotryomycetes sp. JL201]